MLIGLAGGYCAGKSAVAALLVKRGWTEIDADKLGHEAIEMARDAILERFGASVLRPDGSLDRGELARIVFSDPSALADQEAIVHPIAIRLMEELIAAAEAAARKAGLEPRICVHAALLHRAGIVGRLDALIEVRALLIVRVARGLRRDKAGLFAPLRRIARQGGFRRALREALRDPARTEGIRPAPPILLLRNSGTKRALERGLDQTLSLIASRSGSEPTRA